MRVVVIGATGNVGTSTMEALAADPAITSVLGLARRLPEQPPTDSGPPGPSPAAPKTEWAQADIASSDLTALLRGAEAVVDLAWLFQPTRQPYVTWQANVFGSARVMRAVAEAGVPVLVYASSVGAYSPGPPDPDRPVDESWPTHSWPTAAYGREKAYVERMLDTFEAEHSDIRVVRLRPGFIFKRQSATSQRRLFSGPLVPGSLARPELIPVVPHIPGLRLQVVHTDDIAQAYRLAVLGDARGPFNVAAEPVLDGRALARILGARTVRVPAALARAAISAGWHSGLVPADPKLFDLALRLPVMDTTRVREQLGWVPAYGAADTIREFLAGLRAGEDLGTPPLAAATSGPARVGELRTGTSAQP